MTCKPQRIRDPLHNLINFGEDEFERTMWEVIQSHPFQRLRRVRQLGFSDFVYPGATHSRFAHSIGVFHTARRLMTIITDQLSKSEANDHQKLVALAASLVHDVGHGMFSHAFEDVGKKLNLKMAEHEHVSDLLIRDSEIGHILNKELGSGFANDVAEIIGRGRAGNLYDAVVSSQFDADRLDYMRRDRLMSGIQNSGIDYEWLMANLEIGNVPTGADNDQAGEIRTFVLGPKASHAAETYVLALFQLYPTVYFHKTTRAAEKVFSSLMRHLITLICDGKLNKTGLPKNHPICRFALNTESLDHVIALDDTVFWGALSMLVDAKDPLIKNLATRLWTRKLPKCIDVREELVADLNFRPTLPTAEHDRLLRKINKICVQVTENITKWSKTNSKTEHRILTDYGSRNCYSKFQDSKGPLNQIRIKKGSEVLDILESSALIRGQETFHFLRAYVDENDHEAKKMIQSIKEEILRSDKNVD